MKNLKYILVLVFVTSLVNISNAQRVVDHRKKSSKTTKTTTRPTAPKRTGSSTSRRSTSSRANRSTTSQRKVIGSRTNTPNTTPKSKPGFVWKNGHWERKKVPKDVQKGTRMNRKYLKKMEELVTTLNHSNDVWAKDTLLMTFEKYRRLKIDSKYLNYYNLKEEFNKACNDFDAKYGEKEVMDLREVGNFHLLVEGTINDLSNQAFKYFPLPSKATLLPVQNQQTGEANALGFVYYQATGDQQLKLSFDVQLDLDNDEIEKAKESLTDYNVEFQTAFPTKFVDVQEQKISIKGLPGKVIPVGYQSVRVELLLPDDGLSLIKLFTGPMLFDIDYSIQGKLTPFTQKMEMNIEPSLLAQIDRKAILNSFSVIENESLIEVVNITSLLDASQENEETLNRVDVALEFRFENQSVFRGPIRLSSNGTLAADQTIEFLKYSDDYEIKVSGTAYYENGSRTIKPFSTKDQFILIDESKFE